MQKPPESHPCHHTGRVERGQFQTLRFLAEPTSGALSQTHWQLMAAQAFQKQDTFLQETLSLGQEIQGGTGMQDAKHT